jgi:hypothetical protein
MLLVAASVGVLLSGCGFIRTEPREPWRAQAEAACMRSGIVKQSTLIRQTKPIDGPGPCGADLPLKVGGFQNDPNAVALALASTGAPASGFAPSVVELTILKPEATLGCPMVAWTDDWIAGSVQPAAIAWFGQGVSEIRTAGSYACRRRNHRANAKLSEHAFGNAIDVMSFVLNDGNVVTVKGGWRGTEAEQGFLRDTFHGACQRFKTVLGPGSDALHYDHFHLDLAHHDARGTRRYCKPMVAAPQRPAPGNFNSPSPGWGGPQNPYAYNQPNAGQPPYGQPPYGQPALPAPVQRQAGATYDRPANGPQGGSYAGNAYGDDRYAPRGTVGAPAPLTAPAPNTALRDDFDVENEGNKEIEPEFDPKEFDIRTGSVSGSFPDLPRPRLAVPGGPVQNSPAQPLPAPSLPMQGASTPLAEPEATAPRPRARRVVQQRLLHDPAGR